MAFIIEQQARFEENIARQEKQSRENTVNIAKLADVILSLTQVVQRHDDALDRVDRQIAELAERGKEPTLAIMLSFMLSNNTSASTTESSMDHTVSAYVE